MDEFLTGNVWQQVSRRLRRSEKTLAAIAYVTSNEFLKLRRGDTLVCDASEAAIKSGETSAATLGTLLQRGVKVFSCPGLHAKVLVNGKLAVVGSPNLSISSANCLVEAAFATQRFQARAQVRGFTQNTVGISSQIDSAFAARICALPVRRPGWSPRLTRRPRKVGHRTWVVSTKPIGDPRTEAERKVLSRGIKRAEAKRFNPKAEICWIRWSGTSELRLLAKAGDSVIELSRNQTGTRCEVIQPRTILIKQEATNWTRFYIEEPSEFTYFTWSEFKCELNKAGLVRIQKKTTRELNDSEVAAMETIWSKEK